MYKKFLITFFIFFIFKNYSSAYENLLFQPLTANVFEARIGALYEFSEEKVRLDIGASLDLFDFEIIDSCEMRIGGDFFTYTRLRTAGNFKFPVETSDYFFGVNGSVKWENPDLSARLRIAHISSHLVDGMAKDTVFRRAPFVFSRELVDFVAAYQHDCIRPYIGFVLIFSTIPDDVSAFVPQLGFDIHKEINSWLAVTAGYDFKLIGIKNAFAGMNAAQAGFLFKTSAHTGLAINAYYFGGRSMHGMFYKEMDEYAGVGFQLNIY